MKAISSLILCAMPFVAFANFHSPIGSSDFSDWTGVDQAEHNIAVLKNGETVTYTYSDQNRIYYPGIMRNYYGDAADWAEKRGHSVFIDIEIAPLLFFHHKMTNHAT